VRNRGVIDPKERFSNRVDDYVRYRPSYPAGSIDLLHRIAHLGPSTLVADVGSGTGIFSALLLQAGARVVGVEPNAAMRAAAERMFAAEPRFESREGSAEATGLADASVALVTAAQAFHWFEPQRARAEFARILVPGGWAALVWNQRKDTPFNRDYEAMLDRFAPDYANVRERDRAAEPRIRAFFAPFAVDVASFDNAQQFDEVGLRGRLTSSSYVPPKGHPLHEPILAELASIFRAHARDGHVDVSYETVVWYGHLA
jgi:SAM-dependent methyltransferase